VSRTDPIVVLDACVLYPAGLRSLMMWLAVHEVIRPKWTDEIHDEWMRNVLKDRPDLTLENLERTRRLMDAHAGDCLVSGYEKHISTLSLPDPNDHHVLAAAIEADADAIVTWNLKDFPVTTLAEFRIGLLTPDQLILSLLERDPGPVIGAMREHRLSLKNPPKTSLEYLTNLQEQGLTESVKTIGQDPANPL
jgi:predicted nucleic acid-binding protein